MFPKEGLIFDRKHPNGDGRQLVYRFENEWGASVIRWKMNTLGIKIPKLQGKGILRVLDHLVLSYGFEEGRWEVAVIKFYGKGNDDWDLDYSTKITDEDLGVCPDLAPDDVITVLEKIKNLKK